MSLSVDEALSNLKGLAPEYKRSEQYATFEAELDSLARYFQPDITDIPDIAIDEIWALVGSIFEDSKLTPFSAILRKWEKKYGLGPFWGTTNTRGKFRKLSRKDFIKSIGGMAKMVQLWAETFPVAHFLPPVAPVSIKSEALPEKKWSKGLVRTVIGSPITHYISSTIWNYAPNHNFKFWSTSIKIGMPLNGVNLGKLVEQHSTYDVHFAGDFTAFDSTVGSKLSDLIRKVRKKGFSRHRDFAKICFLIDANYKGLLNMPLMTTSTGDIYSKGTGLSTGHSSTSMDNSVALVALYLAAWKKITGLSAHEFRHYCKLSNYGDDHLLSWLATAPASWTAENIMKAMDSFGVGLRDEEPSRNLMRMSFLSKIWRKPSTVDATELAQAGVQCPKIIVFHDPKKLVGKAYAPLAHNSRERNRRVVRLVSYMYLTAHSKDIYDKLAVDVDEILTLKNGKKMKSPVPVPTYGDVLRQWYNPDSHVMEFEDDFTASKSSVEEQALIDYSLDGIADTVVNVLSLIPDLVNPAIYNIGYTNFFIGLLKDQLSWPVELVRRSNSSTSHASTVALLKRTPYDFISDNDKVVSAPNMEPDGALLLRHWLYLLLRPSKSISPVGDIVAWMDKRIATVGFMLNAHVHTSISRVDIPIREIAIIALLSYLPAIPVPFFIRHIRVPSVSGLVESFYTYILNQFWSKVPANMKQAASGLNRLSSEEPILLIEAPTGTGKSTTLVNYISRFYGHKYKRIILVLPRNLLVHSLAPYLTSQFDLKVDVVTEGSAFKESSKLILTTGVEVMLHDQWLTEGNLFLVDESHLLEPITLGLISILKAVRCNVVLMTATPSVLNREIAFQHISLQIANTWEVVETLGSSVNLENSGFDAYWQDYRSRIMSILKSKTRSRFLVFVVDKSHAHQLAAGVGRRTCVLTSSDKQVDPDAEVYIATSVADVGLTIPNVDWVLSSNITRRLVPSNSGGKVSLTYVDEPLRIQRRGRTGRTNNGLFTFIRYSNLADCSNMQTFSDDSVGLELLRSGAPVEMITRFFPGTISSMWGRAYDRTFDDKLDRFAENFKSLSQAVGGTNQRELGSVFDSSRLSNLWLVQGNHVASMLPPVNMSTPTAMTIDGMWKFISKAAVWATERMYVVSPEEAKSYFRSNHVSSDTFVEYVGQANRDTSWADDNYGGMIASDRFGRWSAPSKPVTDLYRKFDLSQEVSPNVEVKAKPVEEEKVDPIRAMARMFLAQQLEREEQEAAAALLAPGPSQNMDPPDHLESLYFSNDGGWAEPTDEVFWTNVLTNHVVSCENPNCTFIENYKSVQHGGETNVNLVLNMLDMICDLRPKENEDKPPDVASAEVVTTPLVEESTQEDDEDDGMWI